MYEDLREDQLCPDASHGLRSGVYYTPPTISISKPSTGWSVSTSSNRILEQKQNCFAQPKYIPHLVLHTAQKMSDINVFWKMILSSL